MTDINTLSARVAALEDRLAAMEQRVITRQVSVVDELGVERVILRATSGTGSVLVRLDRPEGLTTGIELVATEPIDEEPIVGIYAIRDGDSSI
ncbi:MAG: hypothetical protein KDA95_06545 [Acidimicrobiales bacterium]|nr:hypothetical protein [Acidimicrobiales bacterium]